MALRVSLLLLWSSAVYSDEWFSYDPCSIHAPSTWPGACNRPDGTSQLQGSPIDLCGAVPFRGAAPAIATNGYNAPRPVLLANNGHWVQVTLPSGDAAPTLQVGNVAHLVNRSTDPSPQTWSLEYVRFHWGQYVSQGSEHYIAGQSFPLEAQLVHWNAKYGSYAAALASGQPDALLAVAAVFQEGPENPALQALAVAVGTASATPSSLTPRIVFSDLFDASSPYFAYAGSLTAPGCDETVTWVVAQTPLTASWHTLEKLFSTPVNATNPYLGLISDVGNRRPLQPLNGRTVFLSSGASSACAPIPPTTLFCGPNWWANVTAVESSASASPIPAPPANTPPSSPIPNPSASVSPRAASQPSPSPSPLYQGKSSTDPDPISGILEFFSGESYRCEGGTVKGSGSLQFSKSSTLEMILDTIFEVAVELDAGSILQFDSPSAMGCHSRLRMDGASSIGSGTINVQGTGPSHGASVHNCRFNHVDFGLWGPFSGQNRRLDTSAYGTTTFCGSAVASVTVGPQAAAVFQANCSESSVYSDSVDSLVSSDASGLVAFTGVSPSSLPTFIGTWTNPSTTPVAVSLAPTATAFTAYVAVSNSAAVCGAAPATTVDGCASGFTCVVTLEAYGSGQCAVVLRQQAAVAAAAVSTSTGGSSNMALYGLLALLALPIVLAGAWAVWRHKQAAAPAQAETDPYGLVTAEPGVAPGGVAIDMGAERSYPLYMMTTNTPDAQAPSPDVTVEVREAV